jgi:hypothetical protein
MKNYLIETVVFDKNEIDLFMRNSENRQTITWSNFTW